ncbi:hypothetical protein [Nocardia sp. NPDC005745]|uniref:hypothetical protein n=1 Tax=Actinomycetes TaxID=1760 RepID=UPI0033D0365F
MATTLLALALYVLTVARLSRIITNDKIGEPIRDWSIARWPEGSMLRFMFWCAWCMGWWFALALAFPAALVAGLPWWWGFGLWPAASYLVGFLSRYEKD